MTKKIVLLDFDGALANTWQVLATLLLQISKEQGVSHHLNLAQAIKIVQPHRSIIVGTWHLMNEIKIPIFSRIKVLGLINREFNLLVKAGSHYHGMTWQLFNDALPVVIKLQQQGFGLAVVSEHKLARMIEFLTERKILKYLDLGVFSSKQKIKVLERMVGKYPGHQIYYLADKVQDVADAKKVGVIPISITTGLSSRADLEKVNSGMVISSLQQALKLIDKN